MLAQRLGAFPQWKQYVHALGGETNVNVSHAGKVRRSVIVPDEFLNTATPNLSIEVWDKGTSYSDFVSPLFFGSADDVMEMRSYYT